MAGRRRRPRRLRGRRPAEDSLADRNHLTGQCSIDTLHKSQADALRCNRLMAGKEPVILLRRILKQARTHRIYANAARHFDSSRQDEGAKRDIDRRSVGTLADWITIENAA